MNPSLAVPSLPRISVITATYNAAPTLERTIGSVRAQGYPNLEYILVDGRSSDGTLGIIEKNTDIVSKLISESDKGIYDAMNKGIQLATGELIGIINADDAYEKDVLKTVSSLALDHPQVDVFFANMKVASDFSPTRIIRSTPVLYPGVFWKVPICHPTMFVRKRAYRKWGVFEDSHCIASDYELILRFFRRGARFHHCDCVWVEMKGGGVSDVNWRQGKKEVRHIAEQYGIYRGRLKWKFRLILLRIYTAYAIEKIPGLNSLQMVYRSLKFRIRSRRIH